MSIQTFWDFVTTAQVSTALVLIAGALVVIAVKMLEKKQSSR